MITIPQRLREIANDVHEHGLTGSYARLRIIAAELEAPAADAAPVVAYKVIGPRNDLLGIFESGVIAAMMVSKFNAEVGPTLSHPLVLQRDHLATVAALQSEIHKLKTVMIAAAEEISAHWAAHCDTDGYGPQNLLRRLEDGIPSEYGYTAGAFASLQARINALEARQVPDGWTAVPDAITEAMHVAAVRTLVRCTGNDDFPPRVWNAMRLSAPPLPQPDASKEQP